MKNVGAGRVPARNKKTYGLMNTAGDRNGTPLQDPNRKS